MEHRLASSHPGWGVLYYRTLLRHTILDQFRDATTEFHFFLSSHWVVTDKIQNLPCQLLLWQMLLEEKWWVHHASLF